MYVFKLLSCKDMYNGNGRTNAIFVLMLISNTLLFGVTCRVFRYLLIIFSISQNYNNYVYCTASYC
jgi:hypothetical protein